jgi:thiamine biosynthesis protein ThiI
MKKVTLIHYGEISLKGRNRALFEIKLKENIEQATGGSVKRYRGRFVLEGGNTESLKDVFGISWFAEAFKVGKNIESLKQLSLNEIAKRAEGKSSFGVFVRRSDKSFPYTSPELADMIGGEINDKYGIRVDLKKPELSLFIEIADEAYIYFIKVQGLRGFPVDVSGKVLSLLSGGIVSPVASYLMMKRGCGVDFLHFHVFSDNDYVKETKMARIFRSLDRYQNDYNAYLAPYYPFETQMLKAVNTGGHELVLFRRFMVKVAERIAAKSGCKALVTGDSLGQVASQTMDNIAEVNSAVSLPIFQPLISYDKQEIVDLAKRIGTYEDSIAVYKDCCSIVSSNPRTRANRRRLRELEEQFDIDNLVEKTLDLISVYKA